MCKVWWSLEVKHPRTSMTFKRFALKCTCVSWCVLQDLRVHFGWNGCEGFLKFILVFLVWNVREKLPKPTKGYLRRTPLLAKKLSKPAQPTRGNEQTIGPLMPRRWGRRFTISERILIFQSLASNTINGFQYGPSMDRRPVNGNCLWHLQFSAGTQPAQGHF